MNQCTKIKQNSNLPLKLFAQNIDNDVCEGVSSNVLQTNRINDAQQAVRHINDRQLD